ncbi:MAG: hypothetical protein JNL97_08345, partial [Verrucomicrobiales bacterium]|nr:hypothetical protein [Verrucomicrobiales bacterium]
MNLHLLPCWLALTLPVLGAATVTVRTDGPGHPIPPTLWGVFFEDINLSTDGGLYPELVRNRSFEDGGTPEHWKITEPPAAAGDFAIDSSRPLNPLNRHSLRAKLAESAVLENEGYYGMNIVRGDRYLLRLAARAADGFRGRIRARVVAGTRELATGEITDVPGSWKEFALELTASDGDPKARLQLHLDGPGTLFLDMVSLTPLKSWR